MVECSISFFVANDNEDLANNVFEKIYGFALDCDMYDDGEDFCIDCIINIECKPNYETIDKTLTELLEDVLGDDYTTWDYHYISGVDNDFYYVP